jgi:NTE family protein
VAGAVRLGADVVYILRTGCRSTALEPPRTAPAAALHALTVLAEERLLRDIERFGEVVQLEVIPPPSILAASPISFGSTGELIEAAEETATQRLDGQSGGRRHGSSPFVAWPAYDPLSRPHPGEAGCP